MLRARSRCYCKTTIDFLFPEIGPFDNLVFTFCAPRLTPRLAETQHIRTARIYRTFVTTRSEYHSSFVRLPLDPLKNSTTVPGTIRIVPVAREREFLSGSYCILYIPVRQSGAHVLQHFHLVSSFEHARAGKQREQP